VNRLVVALALALVQTLSTADVGARIAAFESQTPSERAAALGELRHGGEAVALAALGGLSQAPLEIRRERAWLVLETGGSASIEPAIAALSDPDAITRGSLLAFLGRTELGDAGLAARIGALSNRATQDVDSALRQRAVTTLADLGHRQAIEALDRLVDEAGARERVQAARLLAQKPIARDLVARRVERAFSTEAVKADDASVAGGDVLAQLLVGYARNLGEDPRGGLDPRERAPLLVAARHPDPRVVRAAGAAFDVLLRRLVQFADGVRAARMLDGFEAQGMDARVSRYQRARLALALGNDAKEARAAARALLETALSGADRDSRLWHARASHLEALALLADGDPESAEASLAAEVAILDGLLAERGDRQAKSRRDAHEECLRQRAVAEITWTVCALARGAAGERPAPEAFEHARAAHAYELELQLHRWGSEIDGSGGWDATLSADLSPATLLFNNPRFPAWTTARMLALRADLGRALASVAQAEMPGFEPWPDLPPEIVSARDDPRRRWFLRAIQYAQFDALSKEQGRLQTKLRELAGDDPTDLDPELLQRLEEIQRALRDFSQVFAHAEANEDALKPTFPSTWALSLARDLADEGESEAARALALRMRDDVELSGVSRRYVGGLELVAEIEMAIGSSYTQDDEPERAEVELAKAVERLEAIESLLKERGVGIDGMLRVQLLRRSALVSLAVNANVKQKDQEKAWRYFDRAWEIAQDDFMRVLRACYLARANRGIEARAMLREVTPGPGTHYNMACTFALLGEKPLALQFLRREFEENRQGAGALAKQRTWAKSDPDLSSLRGEPEFQALVGSR
jgi:hypothetical protein